MSKQRKTVASTYLYDPLDRLATSNSIQRFYNDTRIATEVEGERKSRFFETDSQPLALQQHGSLPGTTLLATDQQTSVLNGVSPEGALHAQAYSPFGHHPIGTSLNGAGFNGERPEPLTGHYLLGQGYRAFNPVLMRFNSPDSWSPFGEGGINAYAYCDNDPANKVDPTGHIPNIWKGLKNIFGRVPKRLRRPANIQRPKPSAAQSETPRNAIYEPEAKNMYDNVAQRQQEKLREELNQKLMDKVYKIEDISNKARTETLTEFQQRALERREIRLRRRALKTAQKVPTFSYKTVTGNDGLPSYSEALTEEINNLRQY